MTLINAAKTHNRAEIIDGGSDSGLRAVLRRGVKVVRPKALLLPLALASVALVATLLTLTPAGGDCSGLSLSALTLTVASCLTASCLTAALVPVVLTLVPAILPAA